MSLSMFGPVSGGALFDREAEVEYICQHCVESVKKPGQRTALSIQGVRKIGKTSIIHEVKPAAQVLEEMVEEAVDILSRKLPENVVFA